MAGIHDNDSSTPNKILAPTGWHVPTDAEWTTLTTYLGGESIAGGKMKSTGTTLWISPNTGATNSNGFTGLPGGFRRNNNDGLFFNIGANGVWWSSTEYNMLYGWCRYLYFDYIYALRAQSDNGSGFSVRCLKGESPLSNTTFETNTLKLYPNPVVSVLNIKTDYNLINQPFTIIDGLGRVILKGKLNEVETSINVEQLSKGIYYLKVSGNSSSKFIKE